MLFTAATAILFDLFSIPFLFATSTQIVMIKLIEAKNTGKKVQYIICRQNNI